MRYGPTPLSAVKAAARYSLIGGPFGSKLVTADYQPAGVPVIRGANLPDSARFSCEDLVYVTEEKVERDLFGNLAFPGDIVVTQRGTLGQVGIIPHDTGFERFVVSQSQMKLTVDPSVADARFVYYALRSPWGQHEITSRAISAGVPHINLRIFQEIQIPLPPLPTQHRVASVLSAYDDHIDNNNRRIGLLEEIVQRIYQEWFVDFRYPGHEGGRNTPTDEGALPPGWSSVPVSDLCEYVVDGDWIETKDQGGGDYRLLQVSNVGVGSFRETGKYRFVTQETFTRLRCTEVEVGDVLVSRMPDPVGRAWYVDHLEQPAITAVDVAIARPRDVSGRYLAFSLNSDATLRHAAQRASGTTRLRITRKDLATFPVLVAPPNIQKKFSDILESVGTLMSTLRLQNRALAASRDLLIPGLVSGETEVEGLDISIEDVA